MICAGRLNVLGRWADMVHWAEAGGVMVGDFLTATGNAWEQDLELLEMLGKR